MTESEKNIDQFYGLLEEDDSDVDFLKSIEGREYGGFIYKWRSKKAYVILHGKKSKGFTDYCNIEFFASLKYAENFLKQKIELEDSLI